ncbi:ABC transporter ATP-binding protein [Thiothrix fructosivorans]|uniref:ABC transporter ATP-binding protein n=1 Tax=Thiothrix fructosivorans TaxID=111770 RepID=A0A8B0SLU5_9GAMM|nr:ABC transporter ATP-binding protein [Thiothrix fructosivorans]MBO0612212.1 ABC transporter ATP-binding protein [Thiothrix fructosivorans]QTX12296.1 ABC transporter ATP-binding protein [Thiothrix fructosivorans]
MNDEPLIALRDVCRQFQVGDETVHALDHVSLDIHAGDYISVMGPSGSGKSTLLNMLGLLDQTNAGSYCFAGRELTTLPEEQRAQVRRDNIGFIFQSFHLIPRLTAAENVELPLVLTGMPASERKIKVRQALTGLGLADRADHRPAQLSGGQQQRVAIARATIMHAPLLLADEPTGNLDSHSSTEVIRILEDLNTQGITLVVVTHDTEIGKRARRRIRMVDGRVVGDDG